MSAGNVLDSIWNMVRALSDFSLSITASICGFEGSVGARVVDSKSTPARSTYLVYKLEVSAGSFRKRLRDLRRNSRNHSGSRLDSTSERMYWSVAWVSVNVDISMHCV